MGHTIWRTGPSGVLSAEGGGYRLVVQAPELAGGRVRWEVRRPTANDGTALCALIASGFGTDVHGAMARAEEVADKLLGRRRGRGA